MLTRLISLLLLGLALPANAGLTASIEPPILRVSTESEPITLDWQKASAPMDRFIVSFLMRGLLKYGPQSEPVCDLCDQFKVSPDGKKYTFTLRPEETWSDGVKLEAQHFVEAFRKLLQPGSHNPGELRAIAGANQSGKWDPKKLGVRAEGKHTLEIELSKPLAIFPHLLTTPRSFPIRHEKSSDAVLGPYLLAAWEQGKRIVLEGNPQYTGERPVYRVEFIYGRHVEGVDRLKKGRIDILSNPTTEDLIQLSGQKIQVNPYWATRMLVLNTRKKPLSDVSLRTAILYGMNRGSLPAFLKNGERSVTGLIPPGLPGYRDLPLATPDASKAQAERARFHSDTPPELKLIVRDSETERKVGQWISGELEKLKIRIKLEALAPSSYLRALEASDFDLALNTWGFEIASPVDLLRAFVTGSSTNWGKWTHVGYDALIEQAQSLPTVAGMKPLIDQATQTLETKEVAVIPLGYPTQPFLLGPRVASFAITPFGDPDLVRIELKH